MRINSSLGGLHFFSENNHEKCVFRIFEKYLIYCLKLEATKVRLFYFEKIYIIQFLKYFYYKNCGSAVVRLIVWVVDSPPPRD